MSFNYGKQLYFWMLYEALVWPTEYADLHAMINGKLSKSDWTLFHISRLKLVIEYLKLSHPTQTQTHTHKIVRKQFEMACLHWCQQTIIYNSPNQLLQNGNNTILILTFYKFRLIALNSLVIRTKYTDSFHISTFTFSFRIWSKTILYLGWKWIFVWFNSADDGSSSFSLKHGCIESIWFVLQFLHSFWGFQVQRTSESNSSPMNK